MRESLNSVQVNKIKILEVTVLYVEFCTLCVQDQYDKLLKDYEAVSRDRGFMTESMTTLKKREEE